MVARKMKPLLLFISPVFPSPDGPGLAMRPYHQIENLSEIFSIHLLVAGFHHETPIHNNVIRKYCDKIDYIRIHHYSGWRYSLWRCYHYFLDNLKCFVAGDYLSFSEDMGDVNYIRHNETLRTLVNMNFYRVHVYRLYRAPVAETLKKQGLNSFYSLDIDDIESETRRSISELISRNGDFGKASRLSRESKVYYNIEKKYIPEYDQIFACSVRDRNILQNRFPGKTITVLPNVVPLQKKTGNRRVNQVFTMLFVGTIVYHPNTDALLFFADQVLPVLREKCRRQWQLRVVGAFPDNEWTRRIEGFPEIKITGWVKDLNLEYDAADVVVAPIRGGGGTRIKILEAFAHGVPVVSTSKGAEGLDVENGMHLFIEDDARLFAEACMRLMTDRGLADEMSRRASALASSKYSPEIIRRIWTGQSPDHSRGQGHE